MVACESDRLRLCVVKYGVLAYICGMTDYRTIIIAGLLAGACAMSLAQAPAGVTTEKKADANSALQPFEGRKGQWHGYDRYDFQCDGRKCIIVAPKQTAEGRPWIWRARFWGHEPQTDLSLLAAGFHVVYMDVAGLFGCPSAVEHWNAFYKLLTDKYGLAPKAALEGMSRGGLIIFNWAAANPDKVACIYADAPVCDFKSWPGGKGKGRGDRGSWNACLKAYGLTEAQAMAYEGNPIDNLQPLAKAKIPLLHVVGAADTTVPVAENTDIVVERYRKLGGRIRVISKPNCEHHPHSLKDPKPIVDFVLKHTGQTKGPTTSRAAGS